MKGKKKEIFLTGATGVMGGAGLRELIKYPERYHVTVLARKSKINEKKLAPFIREGVDVVWGDLLDVNSLKEGVEKADIVLHVGGMVSPQAEHYPEKTMKVNVGSMQKIVDLVKKIESQDPERIIKVVYIGSVSQYGNKLPPDHWGKVGDPLQAAKFDCYSESKIKAEQVLQEAGLKKWVSIRQTSILHAGLLRNIGNPVIFHTPLQGVLEWITTEDSGRLLERLCREEVPESFWNRCYNAGGGEPFRLTNLEFERGLLKSLGCPPPEKVFEPNWFATGNFHGMWFLDSDELDNILHYREKDTFEGALKRLKASTPFYYRLAPLAPAFLIKAIMKKVASKSPHGPLSWIAKGDKARIEAAWGSLEAYKGIPGWKNLREIKPDRRTPVVPKK